MEEKHKCGLPRPTQSELFLGHLPPRTTYHMKLKIILQRIFIASSLNPQCNLFFRSGTTLLYEKKRHALSKYWFVIHPFSSFRLFWEVFMCLPFILSILLVPFLAAFQTTHYSDYSLTVLFTVILFDTAFIVDMLLNFFTGYTLPDTKEIILEPKKIISRYLMTMFYFDFTSAFPVEWFTYVFWEETNKAEARIGLVCVYYFIILFKMWRIPILIKYIQRNVAIFHLSYQVFDTVRIFIISIVYFHWMSCLHIIINFKFKFKGGTIVQDSWMVVHGIHKLNKFGQYQHAVLRTISLTFSVDYGHEPTDRPLEMAVICFNIITGSLIFILLTVHTVQTILLMFSSRLKYAEVLREVEAFLKNKEMPSSTRKRLLNYYEYLFQGKYFNEKSIMNNLPKHFRKEVTMHMCSRLINQVDILSLLGPDKISNLVSEMKNEVFLPRDVIVKAGTLDNCMYFIVCGTVSVTTSTGKEICHLSDGDYFGEVSLVTFKEQRTLTVVAVEITEVYRLEHADLRRVILPYPELYENIKKLSIKRRKYTLGLEHQFREYLVRSSQVSLYGD